jgi:hypothetical protein
VLARRSRASRVAEHRIAPELLRYIDDYLAETTINAAVRRSELDSDSNLIVFYRELFAQLFANVVGERITGISQRSGERARELYRKHRRAWRDPLRQLVRDFQHFCKIYPDLLGEGYSGGNEEISKLHFDLLPSVLAHLESWARQEDETQLETSVADARRRYREFVDAFDPSEYG